MANIYMVTIFVVALSAITLKPVDAAGSGAVWVTDYNISIYIPAKGSEPIFTNINCVFKGATAIHLDTGIIPYNYYFCQNNNTEMYGVIDMPGIMSGIMPGIMNDYTILTRLDTPNPWLQSAVFFGPFVYNVIVDYITFAHYDYHKNDNDNNGPYGSHGLLGSQDLIRTYDTNVVSPYNGTKIYFNCGLHTFIG